MIRIVLLTGFYLIYMLICSTVDVLDNYCCFCVFVQYLQYSVLVQCASLCRYAYWLAGWNYWLEFVFWRYSTSQPNKQFNIHLYCLMFNKRSYLSLHLVEQFVLCLLQKVRYYYGQCHFFF